MTMIDYGTWADTLTRTAADRSRACATGGILAGYRSYLYEYCQAADALDALEADAPGSYHSPEFLPPEQAAFKSAPGYTPPMSFGDYFERMEDLERKKEAAWDMMEVCHDILRSLPEEEAEMLCEVFDLGMTMERAGERHYMSKSAFHRHLQGVLSNLGRIPADTAVC